ncbi:hypothetical protein [Pedobacter sp. ASV28]|uniref:hypothetical protein n=1 Tax=Pedobacter sp. ASV28 TaxID=2795123 RepID=UPI0018ED7350|nr:hypothetical protein [Pedobacter sp. ASV28]
MKKKNILTGILALGLFAAFTVPSAARQTVGEKIEKTAKKVGNKTAEVAVKGSSKVADKVWEGKMAPDGTDVYINNKNQKYYVNKKGKKVYLKNSQIKNRPEKNG